MPSLNQSRLDQISLDFGGATRPIIQMINFNLSIQGQ